MGILEALDERAGELVGRKSGGRDLRELKRVFPVVPEWYLRAMSELRLARSCFSLPRPDPDVLGFGDVMCWLTAAEVRAELQGSGQAGAYINAGLLPIGLGYQRLKDGRLVGLGDPLCVPVRARVEPALVSVSHESGPDADGNLVVAKRLSTLIRTAAITGAAPSLPPRS